jgi:hypothetical protein
MRGIGSNFRPMRRLSGDPEHSSENTRRSRNLVLSYVSSKKDESDAPRSMLGQGLAEQAPEGLSSPGNEPYFQSTTATSARTLCQRYYCSLRPVHREIRAGISACRSSTTTNCASLAYSMLEPARRPILRVCSACPSKPVQPAKHLDPP